jgi:hypothetical protein
MIEMDEMPPKSSPSYGPPTPTHLWSTWSNYALYGTTYYFSPSWKHKNGIQECQSPPELSRYAVFAGLGMGWGFVLGSMLGGKATGLQFLAENAHKLPVTVQGWYFYHKAKNYRVIWGGLKEGLKTSIKFGSILSLFSISEICIDSVRQKEEAVNSVIAGMITGTTFSLISS